jgi:hypothetical protein
MGDNDYENIDGWYPILLQSPPGSGSYVRDPWVSWWEHRSRGSQGGVDCVANEGTAIHAPANCYIQNVSLEAGGSGGRTVIATFNDGWKDVFMHLQKFVSSGSKKKGDTIGYTGRSVAPGYDPVAQHLHWHRIDPAGSSRTYNGKTDPYGPTPRRNPWYYFPGSGTSGGGGYNDIEVPDMTPEEHNAVMSTYKAVFTGGGDAGSKSIIQRLIDLETRVYNIDTQTTGANGFNPSIAHRVIAIQNKLGA